jgi:predicted nucleic acid-binding protein
MIKNKSAIMDNSSLRALYHLNLLDSLILLYSNVYIPREVEKEFLRAKSEETTRYIFITNFYEKNIWFQRCSTYRDSLVELFLADDYTKKLHRGEAEAIVQNQTMQNNCEVLLDEAEAREVAKVQHVCVRGTLSILALLDLRWKKCDYRQSVEILQKKHKARYSQKIINDAYEIIKQELTSGSEGEKNCGK